jgi:formylglycine-generating enzyme required for sulfatase activity
MRTAFQRLAFASIAFAPLAFFQIARAQVPIDDGSEVDPPIVPSASASTSASAPPHPAIAPRPKLPIKDGMIRIPGGIFTFGTFDKTAAPNERPAQHITVAPFWIDRTEVTVAAYAACAANHACPLPAKSSASCTYEAGDPELPISCVHWSDADAYCRSVGKRLPHEMEWEFAARGTSNARYPWGTNFTSCAMAATLLHDATGRTCSGKFPSRVGSHVNNASPFGVVDMTGNVEEWTADYYVETRAEGAMPRAGSSRVLRGGGWMSTPSMSRTTSRNWGSSVEAGPNVGFRCARDGA